MTAVLVILFVATSLVTVGFVVLLMWLGRHTAGANANEPSMFGGPERPVRRQLPPELPGRAASQPDDADRDVFGRPRSTRDAGRDPLGKP